MKCIFAVVVVLVVWTTAAAHDYWLQPDKFFLSPGDHTVVHLNVGSKFSVELERPFQKERTIRFQMLSAHGILDLKNITDDGSFPMADVSATTPGNYLLLMERTPQLITLEAPKFNEYLAEEGLDAVQKERVAMGATGVMGRERYTRYIKTLLQVGTVHDKTFGKVTGQRLEIVPQSNPYDVRPGSTIRFRVYFDGRPLSGVRIFAYNRQSMAEQPHILSATLSSTGIGAFTLDRPGVWIVRLVHMRACTKCTEADWESFWASYSFELR